jgi:hypothetical protein
MGDLPSFGDRQVYGGALAAPTYIDARVLASGGTAETVTVPSGAAIVIFTPLYEDTVFFARYDGSTASAPSGDVSDGSGSEVNPMIRDVRNLPSGTFSLVSPQAGATIIMAFYSDEAEVALQQ